MHARIHDPNTNAITFQLIENSMYDSRGTHRDTFRKKKFEWQWKIPLTAGLAAAGAFVAAFFSAGAAFLAGAGLSAGAAFLAGAGLSAGFLAGAAFLVSLDEEVEAAGAAFLLSPIFTVENKVREKHIKPKINSS